jgi:heat shock protein HslJ
MTLRRTLPTVLLIAGLAATACATGGERGHRARVDALASTGGWALVSATGPDTTRALQGEGIAFVVKFNLDEVVAEGGCNTLRGGYTLAGKTLSFDLAITTRRACTEAGNLADSGFIETMNRPFRAEMFDGTPERLRLTAEDGTVLEFQAKPLRLGQ